MCAFLVYFSKDFIFKACEERRALQWELEQEEGEDSVG